jgi:hypothetical protein
MKLSAMSKVAKVANFCAYGVGDLAGQNLVSKVATSEASLADHPSN